MQLKAHRKRAVLSLREKLHRGGGDRLPIDIVLIKTDASFKDILLRDMVQPPLKGLRSSESLKDHSSASRTLDGSSPKRSQNRSPPLSHRYHQKTQGRRPSMSASTSACYSACESLPLRIRIGITEGIVLVPCRLF